MKKFDPLPSTDVSKATLDAEAIALDAKIAAKRAELAKK